MTEKQRLKTNILLIFKNQMFKRFAPVIFVFIGLFVSARNIQSQVSNLRPTEDLIIKAQIIGVQTFNINTRIKQVISLEIKQNGMDVKVKLLDPHGLVVAQSDYPFSEQDIERIFVVAGEDGTYRLEIESKFPGKKGSVGITLHEIRKSQPEDLKHAEAEQLFSQAHALRVTGKTSDRQKARDIFEQSLKLWQEIGDKTGELRSLAILSYLNRALNNYGKSEEYSEQILQFPDEKEFQSYKFDALYQIGQIQFVTGKIDEAIKTQTTALAQFSNPSPQQANTFNALGNYYQTIAEFEFAQNAFEQALNNIRQFPDMYNEAQIRHTLGLLFITTKDFDSAITNLKLAANLRETFGNRRGQASSLTLLGMSYFYAKRIPESFEVLEKALPISRELDDRENAADTLAFLAVNYRETGDAVKAVELLNQAKSLFRDENSPILTKIYITLGVTQAQLFNFSEARSNFEKSLRNYRKIGDLDGETRSLYQFAKLERAENNLDAAKLKIERALENLEYVQAKYNNIQLLSTFLETRRGYYDLYIDILMRLDEERPGENYSLKALQTSENARMRTLIWQYREAIKNTSQTVDFQLITQIQKIQLQIGEQLSLLAKAQSSDNQSNDIQSIEKTISELNKQDSGLRARLRLSNPNVANLAQPPTLSLAEMQGELDDETTLVEYSLGEERSYLWIVGKDSFQSYVLPKRSDIDAAAKGFYETLSQTTGSPSNRRVLKKVEIPLSGSQKGKDFSAEAEKLGRVLSIEKLTSLPAKRLVFVSDGALNLIPFASLTFPDAGNGSRKFLAERFETAQLPSLTTLHVLRQQNIKPFSPASLAIIADPVFATADDRLSKNRRIKNKEITENSALIAALRDFSLTSLSRLPFTRIEAEKIAQNLPDNTSLNLDFKASRERLMNGEFDAYDVLHFATHGFLNNMHPELSGLVLSLIDEKGNSQNGFLRTRDLYLLKIKPQMVVLSACQTGLGKQVENEGLIGLTRGFLATGTPRIVASLWKVDDTATAELMSRFYRSMLKENQSPSTALRTAQNELKAIPRFSHPRYWAGFTLTGEWR